MAGESIGVEVPIVESFNQVNTWLTNNSDLLIQYGVNVISAILILLSVTLWLKGCR